MEEIIINLHMHTTYSDGSRIFADIAKDAIYAGLDAVIFTDHNVFVQGVDGYYSDSGRKVLVMVGEEIHDQDRDPQKNHLLAVGIHQEFSTLADDPQNLINSVNASGGLTFIAHPKDPELKLFNETDISWEDWEVKGFTGIELWNGFSELKSVIRTNLDALFYAFFPRFIAHAPHPEAIKKWDLLLASGSKVVSVGGSDAHALKKSLGPIHKLIFPYLFHFKAINTHVLLPSPLTGDHRGDSALVMNSLSQGHAFIGYDLPGSTKGFRFTAISQQAEKMMGDTIQLTKSVELKVLTPGKGEVNILRNGVVIRKIDQTEMVTEIDLPGVYRVEVYKNYLGKRRGWIFSNPIYVE